MAWNKAWGPTAWCSPTACRRCSPTAWRGERSTSPCCPSSNWRGPPTWRSSPDSASPRSARRARCCFSRVFRSRRSSAWRLDRESRTSNALAQVLFAEVWSHKPQFELGPLALDRALTEYDAVVRIGDKALFECPPDGVEVHDLGEVWTRASGLPFVFAAWAARPGVVDREIYRILHESRRRGVKVIDRIAENFRWNGHHDPALVRGYLMEHIQYRLGAAEVQAIKRFLTAAERLRLIDRVPEIRLALGRWTSCHEIASRQERAESPGVEIEGVPHVADRT